MSRLNTSEIGVSMKNAHRLGIGQAYVAFSRVKLLEGLFITDFDQKGMKTYDKVAEGRQMENMQSKKIPYTESLQFLSLAKPKWFTIGPLNIRLNGST